MPYLFSYISMYFCQNADMWSMCYRSQRNSQTSLLSHYRKIIEKTGQCTL